MIRAVVRYVDERSGAAPFVKKTLRYVFPDHWSFLLGEVALYTFVLLILTGTYLTLFFKPSLATTHYHGSYAPLQGREMSEAFRSVVDISLSVKAGLLIRQTHHWAADVFVAAITLHLFRIFFTGAFRKPRDLTYLVGVAMLGLTLLEGYLGYSLVDDLLSGMGLAIGYSVLLSVPIVGAYLGNLVWGGAYPGNPAFESRMYVAHILLIPVGIGTLLALHLALVAARHHTQFRGRRRSEQRVVGVPTFPGQAPRSIGLLLATFAVVFLLGGLVQINPIWQWGPYHLAQATNGAQPDWYLGWLIGALRLMPAWDFTIGGYTVVPNPFWGGVLFPTFVFGFMACWPGLERRITGDRRSHNLLDRPRDAPWRTATGAAFFSWIVVVFVAGTADRLFVNFGFPYSTQLWVYRVLFIVLPVVVFVVVRRVCEALLDSERIRHVREAAEREAREENAASDPILVTATAARPE